MQWETTTLVGYPRVHSGTRSQGPPLQLQAWRPHMQQTAFHLRDFEDSDLSYGGVGVVCGAHGGWGWGGGGGHDVRR